VEKASKTGAEKLTARRLMIVEAAVHCFIENGFHQTGMREIAKQAGVSLGNMYNHFKGKDEILLTITAIEAEEIGVFVDILAQPVAPRQALKMFIEAYLRYSLEPENALISLEILTVAMRNPRIFEGFSQNRTALVVAISEVLAKINSCEKNGPKDGDIEVSKMVLDLIEGFAVRNVLQGEKLTEASDQVLWNMINGALKPL